MIPFIFIENDMSLYHLNKETHTRESIGKAHTLPPGDDELFACC